MKTYYQSMKNILNMNIWSALLLTTALFAACSTEDTAFEMDMNEDFQAQQEAQKDEVMKLLETVPGVTDIKLTEDANGEKLYTFNFSQKADHEKTDSYTFKQAGLLHYVDADAPVVLITQGYSLTSPAKFDGCDLATYLKANAIEIEYRYFGTSQPESGEDLTYTNLNSEQAAFDLHKVVSAFKQSMFKNNKWVATGTSKSGITSAFYAYYADRNNWNDMDLYMPFCAPFLTGTDATPEDNCTGLYLEYSCGNGYAEGTVEKKAFERLQKLPLAITDNAAIRKFCTEQMAQSGSDNYVKVLKNYNAKNQYTTGNLEKDMTIITLDTYLTNLYMKFSYIPFSKWAPYVPDAATAMDDETSAMMLRSFIFDDFQTFAKKLPTNITRGAGVSYEEGELLNILHADKNSTYEIQAITQLGVSRTSYKLVSTSTYLTAAEIEKVRPLTSVYYKYKKVTENHDLKWDGGKLMGAFREWVVGQNTMPILFIYGKNDPWTGGQIDTPLSTSKTQVIYNPGGYHNDDILGESYKSVASQIQAAVNKALGI